MKKSVKAMLPISKGHTVAVKLHTHGGLSWKSDSVANNEFRLSEYADGTTELCHIYPDGRMELDGDSVPIQSLYCLHCGEALIPEYDVYTCKPDPYNYYCAACGKHIKICKEDE